MLYVAETSNMVRVGDVTIFVSSDKNGQDQELVHQRDSAIGTVWRENTRQDWGGMDMYGGKMMGILGEGCWWWSCQERGNGEGLKGCWERTWHWLKWRRRIQKLVPNGDGKSAVATLDGRSRKKKKITWFSEALEAAVSILSRPHTSCARIYDWSVRYFGMVPPSVIVLLPTKYFSGLEGRATSREVSPNHKRLCNHMTELRKMVGIWPIHFSGGCGVWCEIPPVDDSILLIRFS